MTTAEWKEMTLGDAGVQLQHGYTFPSGDLSPDGELPVVRIGNVQRGQIVIDENVRYTGALSREDLSKQLIAYGDLLMALTGGDESNLNTSTGRVGRYGLKEPALLNQRVAKVLPSENVDASFLFYLLQQPSITRHLASTANGSVQRNLTNGHVLGLEVALPSFDEQRSIAAVLSSLDDKIELLRRQNETLEQVAQAIFNEWFIKPTADGSMPDGWKQSVLGEFVDVERGLSYNGKGLAEDGGMPLINLGNFSLAGIFAPEKTKHYKGEYRDRHIVRQGEILIANTDITQEKVVLGSPIIMPLDGEALFTHHVYRVKEKGRLPRFFLYHLFKTAAYRARAFGFATGTTVLALPQDAITEMPFALPPKELLSRFDELATALYAKMTTNNKQTLTLQVVSDTLLPRLMSGDIRV